ncbi:MAG: MlaD family protein, partial [Nitrospirota bacterium]
MKDEIKAGIIIVAAIAILSAFIILIGGVRFFEKLDTYSVKVMNAAGLETGSQVRLGGVRVGRVLTISPPDKAGAPVAIEIGIKKGTVLYKGTKALITQIGFVGDIYLLLSVTDTTDEIIKVGDTIPSEERVQMDVLMVKLDGLSGSVDKLLRDVDRLFDEKNVRGIEALIGNTNSAVVSGSANVERMAASLKATADKLERVLNQIEGVVEGNKDEVALLIKKAREDIEKAGGMIKSIESTARSVEMTSKTADRAIVH